LIYPQIYQTGYGRFRPNKSDDHLSCRYYRGGWHRSFPALIPWPINSQEKRTLSARTWSSLITVSCSVKFSRLLHPVGSGFVSQNPSPGYVSQHPYASMARRSVTPPTTWYAADPSYAVTFEPHTVPGVVIYPVLFSVSRGYSGA
jgi:hypothetical protein